MGLFVGIILSLFVFLMGFPKNKKTNNKKVIWSVLFYSLSLLILIYSIGLLTGYARTPYSLTPLNIIKNTFPVLLVIILVELLRFNICQKSDNDFYINIISILIFTAIDILLVLNGYDKSDMSDLMRLWSIVILPSLIKNSMLNKLSYRYGYYPCMIYQCVMSLYIYIIPITPDLGYYLYSVTLVLEPIIVVGIIDCLFRERDNTISFPSKRTSIKLKKIYNTAIIVFMVIVIGLSSDLLPYWISVVGTGSMQPTINIGDIIIVDKIIAKRLDKLKVGDILVFRIKDNIYTHRIIGISEKNGMYSISTKGDRKGNAVDNWIVNNDDVVGVVKQKIPYLGYPTVWLSRIIKESKNET